MELIQTLMDGDREKMEPTLPQALRDLYGGDLHFPTPPAERPLVIGNFVSTLDGIVSYQIKGHSDGSTISGSDTGDRFIMGLLRASADAVIAGAKTVREAGSGALWFPEYTYPGAKQSYAEYRRNVLRKPEYPLLVIVSGSGRLDMERAIFQTPAAHTIIVTTSAGGDEIRKNSAAQRSNVEVHVLAAVEGSIPPPAIMQLLHAQFGVKILLHEGGPALFGQFLAAGFIDELFLTLSPQIGGRAARTTRPGIAQNVEFTPNNAPWFQLQSLKQKGDHLYLRYRHTWPATARPRSSDPQR
ncbi:MAG: dihydrofolate reductase family protein [Acidobacteriaceae bacterium]